MEKQLIYQASTAFQDGRYLDAYDSYRRSEYTLGVGIVTANLMLCMQRFRNGKTIDSLSLQDLKMACIMDDFTWHSYKDECNILQISPQNALNELENFQPDMLFIESAWRGKDSLWDKKISHMSPELHSVVVWCQNQHIPTVFWNKEDPVHFNTFLNTASYFDFVFTTDIDCISHYKKALGHERVFLLPFACQPRINNPIEQYKRKEAFCFAGAYYVRYPERTQNLKDYIETLPKFRPVEIFDRNYGKIDINYQFPIEYNPFIVGTLPYDEINRAYKGYSYAINLNSIKQSQTMFARRVYELLASNTVTVSNFSRGIRLLFGDLVFCSDSGRELLCRLQELDAFSLRKLRLAGLRKVLDGHCYEDRLGYIAEKVLGIKKKNTLPRILALAFVPTENEAHVVLSSFFIQTYQSKKMILLTTKDKKNDITALFTQTNIEVLILKDISTVPLDSLIDESVWVTLLSPEDWYGPNYFLDLVLATRYSPVPTIGKAERWRRDKEGILTVEAGRAYHLENTMPLRRCAVRGSTLERTQPLGEWLAGISNGHTYTGLAIDPFNYCELGLNNSDGVDAARVAGEHALDTGLPIEEVLRSAEALLPAMDASASSSQWNARKLSELFNKVQHTHVTFTLQEDSFAVISTLEGTHVYFYSSDLSVSNLPTQQNLQLWLDVTPGLNIQYVFTFKNAKKEKISHTILAANKNCIAEIPDETHFFSLGLRVYGSGNARIRSLEFKHRKLDRSVILGKNETLLLTNNYPQYDDLYRNGFVHSRVQAYREMGVGVDVFRLRPDVPTTFHEFQQIDVITGNKNELYKILASGRYKRVIVHFLDPQMWSVLEKFPTLSKIVWVHGAEIQPWQRRSYNYTTKVELEKAQKASKNRVEFWRSILDPLAPSLKLVFVSHYFAEEVMNDYDLHLPKSSFYTIHNPIDTIHFSYVPKTAAHRKKILSISSYASKKYANDLTVAAILRLAKKTFFGELHFHLLGDGPLFEETLAPLRKFPNVTIERRFLLREDIAILHRENGIFLVPSRWDSQGVSRDEAMSSGLVPVTNNVAAIPEFMDESCGILAPPEDAAALADGIEKLYHSPELFLKMSKAAAERVRKQSRKEIIIDKEIEILNKVQCI